MNRFLTLVGALARLLAALANRWPLVLIAVFLISPEGPHLRLSYSYQGSYDNPDGFDDCVYLGSRGLIRPVYGYMDGCPVIAWIDAREAVR